MNNKFNTKYFIFFIILFVSCLSFGQNKNSFEKKIDSLIESKTTKPFNGIILISQNGKVKYSKIVGYSDLEKKTPLQINNQFVIGSISKQITAVLVLQEYEKGHLKLNEPLHTYLPELTQKWADTVTIHHLLTHMHGIVALDKPTAFKVGSQFNYSYSNTGYDLLSKITERTSGKSFAMQSKELFQKCGMKNTFHPDDKEYKNLVKGYSEQENGELLFEENSFRNAPAAGSFVSNATDLNIWNQNLQAGKLLKPAAFKIMTSKQEGAIRQHPLSGITHYGYGITIDTKDKMTQLGQTGFAPGFVSMNFYFPETKTSLIILENIVYEPNYLKKTFFYHSEILKIIRQEIK
ncbi:serine hydrolase domain-containing protein [Flavobacterium sp. IMCC34518]|uniref:serine hydrolase domain-containing protein n=1 Tax=Flavobacterium sp. IMCC34518 TaxID=3003623 RepID=UPI0022ABEF32|nr:serine hydrolase domain-containing protein [Flavobacterium sp. IMCC34518]